MSCWQFSKANLERLKKGERLFVPGVDPEKYDLWEIEYEKAPWVMADNYFGEQNRPVKATVNISAIDGETEEDAANRFKTWCDRVYNAASFKSPCVTITSIRYVKAEENSEI